MSVNATQLDQLDWLDLLQSSRPVAGPAKKVLTVFGTRPEAIKLSPVIQQLQTHGHLFRTVNVASSQHTDLLYPFLRLFGINVDHDLQAMRHDQTPNQLCSRVLASLDAILSYEQPDLILVQGDTTTALAGALAGFHHGVPVAHVEAGLRSGNIRSPYPEETNRRLISSLATYHFAATSRNSVTLRSEGVAESNIYLTGNPVVDALKAVLANKRVSAPVAELLKLTDGLRRIVLTTHRRESFGQVMAENLRAMRRFVEAHEDVALVFPVHLNPTVAQLAQVILSGHDRIHLIQPLDYVDFISLLSHAWLIVSDSGGVQEEAPTLGKPLLILRDNTERPEVIEAGVARLVGERHERLPGMLEEAYAQGSWAEQVTEVLNPFGQGDSGQRIARIVAELLEVAVPAALSPS